jgi:hypothetical protein
VPITNQRHYAARFFQFETANDEDAKRDEETRAKEMTMKMMREKARAHLQCRFRVLKAIRIVEKRQDVGKKFWTGSVGQGIQHYRRGQGRAKDTRQHVQDAFALLPGGVVHSCSSFMPRRVQQRPADPEGT